MPKEKCKEKIYNGSTTLFPFSMYSS
jgi:hypothetical protein